LADDNESYTRAPVLLEVERFEHVRACAERVLLRVDGRYGDRPGKRVLDARLFVDDGLAVHRHAPLDDHAPGAGDDAWLWRVAFEVPASYLTDARTRFAIESEPGSLIDLPRPAEAVSASAVPLTARSARIARRYAAAIAVVLSVAVAPGALPSQARVEVLRVHHADGTVAYVTSDGQPLASIPPDAVVVDQPAPAAPAAPAPAPAPDPQPAAPPAMSAAQDPGHSAAPTKSSPKPGAAGHDKGTKKAPDHRAAAQSRAAAPSASQPSGNGPAATPAAAGPAKDSRHPGKPHGHTGVTPPKPPTSPADVAPLSTLPGLVIADAAPLDQYQPDLPTSGFEPIGQLASDAPAPAPAPTTAHDTSSTGGTPTMTGVPDLITPPPPPSTPAPAADHGRTQRHSGSRHAAPAPARESEPGTTGGHSAPSSSGGQAPGSSTSGPASGGAPGTSTGTPGGFFDQLPGPGNVQGVPNFVIQKFHVPPFLLSIYQAAGIQYGIRWEVLAAINEIETDYGRNLNVSSAGALGWMQFMPSTWKMYGVDANRDGKRDPYNPVDAIFAAARYLKAAGGDTDVRRSIFAYNHAGWYVDSVMLRARLIAGYPPDLIGSLTGLTEGRFPVAAQARYADDQTSKSKQVKVGQNAANIVDSSTTRRSVDIYAKPGSPVVAVNDGVIKEIGRSKSRGNYVVLQDVYGNRYTYSGLGSLSKLYPVPKQDAKASKAKSHFQPVGAHDPKPSAPASAGTQRPGAPVPAPKRSRTAAKRAHSRVVAVKERLFAHPQRPASKGHGGADQLVATASLPGDYSNYFSKPLGLNSKNATLKRLKKGSHVVGSTILGRIGKGANPHVTFEIQPAGKGAPQIDPKPFLDGWKLLESTAIYRAKGRNVLYGDGDYSIGEIMLLPKALLAKRVLSDPRITIYPGGRQDIATGQIDRRVLVVLAYLAESGLKPTVSCLKAGHSEMTSSGNVSEHWSGNAVDISAINGVPIIGHQGAGDVAEQAVKRLMQLQGTVQPHQIISLLDFGRNTMAMPDHANHIHVGFRPLFGQNTKLGRQTQSVLKPGQWDTLVQRLGQIQNPSVPTSPSKYSLPSRGGQGE
jgi:hypothetical protein